MQKRFRSIAILALALFMVLGLCACQEDTAFGEELIKNGDFAEVSGDKLVDWKSTNYYNAATFTAVAESTEDGGYCAHLNASTANDARIEQTVSVSPNSYYRITCRVKTKNVVGGAGANVSVLLSIARSEGVFGDTDWQTLTLIGKTASDQTEIDVALRIGGYSAESSGEAWFDDVSVVKISESEAGSRVSDFTHVVGGSSSNNNNLNESESEKKERIESEALDMYAKMAAATILIGLALAILYFRIIKPKEELKPVSGDDPKRMVFGALFLGLILRVILSLIFTGHSTDIGCFSAWSNTVADVGFSEFYTTTSFCDYPPGYMVVLWVIGNIIRLFQIEYGTGLYYIMLKLPTIIADLAVAYLLYRFCKTRFPKRITYFVLFIAALNPAFMFLSGAWGQIDQLLTLCIVASFLMLIDEKPIWAGVLYGAAVLLKPQAFIVGPVIFVAYMLYIRNKDEKNRFGLTALGYLLGLLGAGAFVLLPAENGSLGLYAFIALAGTALVLFVIDAIRSRGERRKAIIKTHIAVASVFAMVLLVCMLFKGSQPFDWFMDKYLGTSSSYPYATIEAYNLFGLFGANWQSSSLPVTISLGEINISLGLSYETLGTIFIVLSCVYAIIMYWFGHKKNKHAALLAAAFLVASVFALGHFMHERYLFPALTLMLFAFVFYNDRRIMASFLIFTCSLLLNSMGAMYVITDQYCRIEVYDTLVRVGSALTMVGYVYFAYTCTSIMIKGNYMPAISTKRSLELIKEEEVLSKMSRSERIKHEDKERAKEFDGKQLKLLPEPTDTKLHLTKRDRLYVIILTVVYAVIALLNLGTTQAPETYDILNRGDSFNITLNSSEYVADVRFYTGLETAGQANINLTLDNGTSSSFTVKNGNMFRWTSAATPNTEVKSININVVSGAAWVFEIALFDYDGNYIPYTVDSNIASKVNDEPEEVPEVPSYLNGMYFDELYHARTAYEHLNGLVPYEITHPPLGKIIISAGIALFGMNTIGWRISGTVLGIIMLPILYFFTKRLFKRSELALFATGLFAFDFMHFTQTRIATIDVYAVFFILLMYYYMYQYFRMNFHVDGVKKTLKPLALAGFFFGCGAASKWTGIYAGVGLAVILAVSLYQRWNEYYRVNRVGTNEEKKKVRDCGKNTIKTLLWCCVFFIAVPVVIYVLSYIPYFTVEGAQGILENQEYMLSYHSGLTSTHSFSSSWYAWPFTVRPIWYYQGRYLASGYTGTIVASGNPAVWWLCTIATFILLFLVFTKRMKVEKGMTVAVAGLCANYLPWMLVSRCTFIYHFFTTVPFIIICATYLVKHVEDKYEQTIKHIKAFKWIWLLAAIVLFAVFYPVMSGTTASASYVHSLEWFPTWYFTSIG